MPETSSAYVLDSYALLAYYQAEAGSTTVLELLEAARDEKAILYLSLINAGELYYILFRQRGPEAANEMLENLRKLPIALASISDDRVFAAARLKAEHRLSYADAFAATLAKELDATLVTGDPEFRSIENLIPVVWLQSNSLL